MFSRVQAYLATLQLNLRDTDVVVRAFANLTDLGAACIRNRRMKKDVSINLFAKGFSQRKGLFDFVDVGSGKEKADHKIRSESARSLT